jgi:hypothetical protein|tara:strand:- start:107 stop:286 length:180 start_codon:yes stop_codon:yes gene_type:complete
MPLMATLTHKETTMDYTHNLSFPARNLVAKHARKFNKNAVMVDRKKRLAAGYEKHKGKK